MFVLAASPAKRPSSVFGGQPEVRQAFRKLHTSESLLNPNTIGLVSPRFNLVVHLAEDSRPDTTESKEKRAAVILKKVADWAEAHRPR